MLSSHHDSDSDDELLNSIIAADPKVQQNIAAHSSRSKQASKKSTSEEKLGDIELQSSDTKSRPKSTIKTMTPPKQATNTTSSKTIASSLVKASNHSDSYVALGDEEEKKTKTAAKSKKSKPMERRDSDSDLDSGNMCGCMGMFGKKKSNTSKKKVRDYAETNGSYSPPSAKI